MIDFKYIHQSSWLGNLLNEYHKVPGTFVEIGVGNIIAHDFIGNEDRYTLPWNELPVLGSNTIELLQNGWEGYYIDPEKGFNEQAYLLAPDKSKIKTMAVGCGCITEVKRLGLGESFLSNNFVSDCSWVGKEHTIKNTTEVLTELGVPHEFDFLSIDVEGYELEVLKGLDLNLYKPKSVFIEINVSPLNDIIQMLPNYTLIQSDYLNAFFSRNY